MSIEQKRARLLEQRQEDEYDEESYSIESSPIAGNEEYYKNHPDSYSESKIDRETWLPKETRDQIKRDMREVLTTKYGSIKTKVKIRGHYYVQQRYAHGVLGGRIYSSVRAKRKRLAA